MESDRISRCLGVVALAFAGGCAAGPWADPGDLRLRHDLQLLADGGQLAIPLATWPLAWPDIARGVRAIPPDAGLTPAEAAARDRLERAVRRESRVDTLEGTLRASLALEPLRLRGFADTPREEGELGVALEWMGERFAWRLDLTAAASADDGQPLRADGSYAGFVLGNWTFSAGWIDRWWGPGWQGSAILGSNARPIPALALERNLSTPFAWPLLEWLGPWKLAAFLGRLEGAREVPRALLFGLRVDLKPHPLVEIGLSRTAQLCGAGRPCGLDTFGKMLAGADNTGTGNEPGNQLGGADLRVAAPLRFPLALYAQWVGEDEAGGLPSRDFGLAGLETWGGYGDRSWRAWAELADTAADNFGPSYVGDRYNVVYEHHIYRSGYRYRGRSLGHPADNDADLLSLGGLLADGERDWQLTLTGGTLNRDGAGDRNTASPGARADYLAAGLSHRRPLEWGQLLLGIGWERIEPDSGSERGGLNAFIGWRSRS